MTGTYPQRAHAYGDDALGISDATDLVAALRSGSVSVSELMDAAIARAHRVNESINAVQCWVRPSELNMTAEESDAVAQLPFAGLPTVLKDNEDLSGYPSRQGSTAVGDSPRDRTSVMSRLLQSAGLRVFAKTTLPEFGLTASTESTLSGATSSPWDLSRTAGGSSGGSAALVAAGVVPLAHGNDGGGSVRIPAACCGLVGLKPTVGRLPQVEGTERAPINFVSQGVLTRTVRDTELFYQAAEGIHYDPRWPRMAGVDHDHAQQLRIAFFTDGQAGVTTDASTVAAVEHAAKLCEGLGHKVTYIDYPYSPQFGVDFLRFWGLNALLLKRLGRVMYPQGFDPKKLEKLCLGLADHGRQQAFRMPATIQRLKATGDNFDQFMEQFDVVISPVLSHEPPELGYLGPDVEYREQVIRLLKYAAFTEIHNISGAPAMSLPLYRTADARPIGVQFAARRGNDRVLLELAYQLEEADPWPRIDQVTSP